jgi:hypothetical protein
MVQLVDEELPFSNEMGVPVTASMSAEDWAGVVVNEKKESIVYKEMLERWWW